jgi:lysophospholipase L1-like esterase
MKKLLLLTALVLFSAFSPKKEISWVAIGDSITYHNGKPWATRNRLTHGYMDDVAEKLPYIHFTNQGYGGWTAKTMADNIEKIGVTKADIYTILLGTNDWWTCLSIGTLNDYTNNTGNGTVYGAYRTIINKIHSLNSDAKIILLTPMQRTDFVDVNDSTSIIYGCYKANKTGHFLSEYADAIKSIAKAENFKLVDLYNKSGITIQNAVKFRRLRDPKTGVYKNYTYPDYVGVPYDPRKDDYPYPLDAIDMTYDGLHPSNKGHQVIADMLVEVMKKM